MFCVYNFYVFYAVLWLNWFLFVLVQTKLQKQGNGMVPGDISNDMRSLMTL